MKSFSLKAHLRIGVVLFFLGGILLPPTGTGQDHGIQIPRESGRLTATPLFDPSLISALDIDANLIGKTEWPDDLPLDRKDSFGGNGDMPADLTKLSAEDPRWTPAVRAFWAPKIAMLQEEMRAVKALVPGLNNTFPMYIRISGTSNALICDHYVNAFAPSDFNDPGIIRKKLMRAALNERLNGSSNDFRERLKAIPHEKISVGAEQSFTRDSADLATILATSYALSRDHGSPHPSRLRPRPDFHWDGTAVGQFETAVRSAAYFKERSPRVFKAGTDDARREALRLYGELLPYNRPSPDGVSEVLQSFLRAFGEQAGKRKIFEDWFQFALANADNPEATKILIPPSTYSATEAAPIVTISVLRLLDCYQARLPEHESALFAKLRDLFGLDENRLGSYELESVLREGRPGLNLWDDVIHRTGAHARSINVPRPAEKEPIARRMPTIGEWNPRPEDMAEFSTARHSYRVTRDLDDYMNKLPPEFSSHLASLGPEGKILDAGMGEGHAFETYLTMKNLSPTPSFGGTNDTDAPGTRSRAWRKIATTPYGQRANIIGITVQMKRPAPREYGHRFKIIKGYLEQIPEDEIGKVDIITDVVGILSYAGWKDRRLDPTLEKYFRLLKPNGAIYVAQDNQIYIENKADKIETLEAWLGKRPGVHVVSDSENTRTYSIHVDPGQAIKLPALELVFSDADSPPRRLFKER